MSPGFAIVLVHGSYHTPKPYAPFIQSLKEAGIVAFCPQLPSSDPIKLQLGDSSTPDYDQAAPKSGFPQPADDVKVIEELLENLICGQGRNVLLLGHSAGGFTASAAALPKFLAKNRKPKMGGVIGIYYICAFLVPVGESINSFFQPKDGSDPIIPPYCKFHQHGTDVLVSTINGAKFFFNGLDEEQAEIYENTLTATAIPTTVLTNDAYTSLPCAYLVTEDDLALDPKYQEGMVALHNQREGVDIKVSRAKSGHSPHLTWKEGLLEDVLRFGNENLR